MAIAIVSGCKNTTSKQAQTDTISTIGIEKDAPQRAANDPENRATLDTVYPGKNYVISLSSFDKDSDDETLPNSVFSFWISENTEPVFTDSLYSRTQEIPFLDFNGDEVPDILLAIFLMPVAIPPIIFI